MKTKTRSAKKLKDHMLTKFSRSVREMQAALIECRGLLQGINGQAAKDPAKDRETRICQEKLKVLEARVTAVLDRYQVTIGEMKRTS